MKNIPLKRSDRSSGKTKIPSTPLLNRGRQLLRSSLEEWEKMDEKEKLKASLDQIHAEESLKTSTKKYLLKKVYFKEKKRSSPLRKFAAAAVCSLAVFIGGGSWLFFTPTAFISVDVNPSLELGINRFDRIVSVTGYNEDGRHWPGIFILSIWIIPMLLETLMEDQNMKFTWPTMQMLF